MLSQVLGVGPVALDHAPLDLGGVGDGAPVERNRSPNRWRSGAHVHDVGPVERDEASVVVRGRSRVAVIAEHPGGDAVGVEAEVPEEPAEQSVQLEAEAAALALDDFLVEVG